MKKIWCLFLLAALIFCGLIVGHVSSKKPANTGLDHAHTRDSQELPLIEAESETAAPQAAKKLTQTLDSSYVIENNDLGPIANSATTWDAFHTAPEEWLARQSAFVRDAVVNKRFAFSEDGVMGVIDESGKFVTWPGAPIQLSSENKMPGI